MLASMITEVRNVTVLLATFNGEKYLEKQLLSLANQKDVIVDVIAQDDGSTDGTRDILESWKESGLISVIYQSNRIGPTRSFMKMLKQCNDKEMIAFCDQDDIWNHKKLVTQIEKLDHTLPTAVITSRRYINELDRVIGESDNLKIEPCIENAMVENVAYGNTILLNNQAIKLINSIESARVKNYDSWIYLVVAAFGKVIYLSEPLIDYRIHRDNSVGLRSHSINKIISAVDNYVDQNLLFLSNFKTGLSSAQISCLEGFLELKNEKKILKRLKLVQKIRFKRQKILDQIIFKLIVILKT